MKNLIKLLTLITVFFGFFLNSAYADPKKIGFIYIGPPGIMVGLINMIKDVKTWLVHLEIV